jgi:DNA polymerase V
MLNIRLVSRSAIVDQGEPMSVGQSHFHSQKAPLIHCHLSTVAAGFPSPADDYAEVPLSIHDLVKPNSASFFMQVEGNSMTGDGIFDNDIVFVDRSLTAEDGDVVVASLTDGFAIKRYTVRGNGCILQSTDPSIPPIASESEDFEDIWGVVTHVIHTTRKTIRPR